MERLIEHSGQSESINYDSLTANVNEIFCIAHTYYVNVVKKFCVDYNLYKRLILSSIKHKLRKWLELKDINWQFAFNIFEHVLLEKKNLLIDFFETQPIGDYCGLIRSTLGKRICMWDIAARQNPRLYSMLMVSFSDQCLRRF